MKRLIEYLYNNLPTEEMVVEMSVHTKDYKSRVNGIRFQIVENWCLCEYCKLYSSDNVNFSHWMRELKAHINNLKMLNLKSGNKRTILQKMLIEDYDYDDANMIVRIITDKFASENIVDADILSKVSISFSDSIQGLIDIISIDTLTTDAYLQKTFLD